MKRNNKVIGITGNISSGKSVVLKFLSENGYLTIDADKIAHEIINIGECGYVKIVETFGKSILKNDNSLDRKLLGELIFSDDEKRHKLNKIMHPIIQKEIKDRIENALETEYLIFVDIPLLFENKHEIELTKIKFDQIWLVFVDKEIQLKRLMKRDLIDEKLALKKIKAQMNSEEKKLLADVVLDNNKSVDKLLEQVNRQLEFLIDDMGV